MSKEKQFDKDYFTLVQENERLVDKPLRTKQLSYFQDAMLRFTKNKYNLTATVILVIMILMSIFVPIMTPSRLYTGSNSTIQTLPPRIPILEHFGIFDGTKLYKNQSIAINSIVYDDEGKVIGGLPDGFDEAYIKPGSIRYSYQTGSEINEKYVGGTVALFVNANRDSYAVVSPTIFSYTSDHIIRLDIEEMSSLGTLRIYLSDIGVGTSSRTWESLQLVGEITEAGVFELDPHTVLGGDQSGFLVLRYSLPEIAENGREFVKLNSIQIINNSGAEEVVARDYEGFGLASFNFFVLRPGLENGRYVRENARMLVSSFVYDVYGALFADRPRVIGKVEYEKILADNPGMEDSIVFPDPDNLNTWEFGNGFPIAKVVSTSDRTIGGIVYTNYNVLMDGAFAIGFDDTPYFLFGTDVFGKDLFTLIWLGLRTSLLLGFLAAAVNIFIGIIWGSVSAYYGGQVDILMERFKDIWGSFPQITMIGIITVMIGPGFLALFIFMVYDGWIGAAAITRIQFYRYRGREYVLAARTLGASDARLIFKHILPNALGTIVTRVVLSIPSVIFLEVNLSYLGFGIGNGQSLSIGPVELTGTSIGVILNDGQQQIMAGNTWLVLFPTLVVSVLMISFNMFGNALRDALNPTLRGSE